MVLDIRMLVQFSIFPTPQDNHHLCIMHAPQSGKVNVLAWCSLNTQSGFQTYEIHHQSSKRYLRIETITSNVGI